MKSLLILVALLSTQLQETSKRVIIRLAAEDPAEIVESVKTFEKADIPFAMERLLRPEDTPEMKSALAMVVWKNNELVKEVPQFPSIEVVDASPENMGAVISRALGEGWNVKTPTVWRKLLKDESRTYGGRNFYVSATGDDNSDGLTPQTAWRSLSRVNDAVLGYSDTIRFRCGDVFRGSLIPQSGRQGQPIVYMSYGKGTKPALQPSFDASSEKDWVQVEKNLWKCEKPSANELANVIFNHGDADCGYKVDRKEQMGGRDLHFCWIREEQAVYMVSASNPATRFASIELAAKQHIIDETDCHDIVYDGLWLRYGAAHGIGGSGVKNISILNCDICWIGGSTLYIDEGGRGVYYGNGIEFWSAAEDVLIENCRVWECWDAGITNQSNIDGVLQKNITIRGNQIWNCEYSYEYWQQGEGARTENIVFENNRCWDAGYGWGHRRRWNPNAAHLMFYDTTADTKGFFIRGNRFERSKNCGIRLFNAWYDALTMENNHWYIPGELLCRYHGRPTSGLIYKNPDHLDRTHQDSEKIIEGQTIEKPLKIRFSKKGMKLFNKKFCQTK